MGFRVPLAALSLRVLAVCAGLLLLVATHGGPAPTVHAAGDCTVTATEAGLDTEEQTFLTLINNYRVANGRTALTASYTLTRASAWKSKDMGTLSYFAHDDTPIARSWSQRIRDCGYGFNTYLGENIAAGYTTADAVFNGWKNSPGHNSNMLGSNYTTIGIGRHYVAGSPYGWYWTTDFGGYDDGWMRAPEIITPLGTISPITDPSVIPTVEQAPVAVSPLQSARPVAGGGGGISGPLDFSRTCATLRERESPLADLFCGKKH